MPRLTAWADGWEGSGGKLALFKGPKRLDVTFLRTDLADGLDAALGVGGQSGHGGRLVRPRFGGVHCAVRGRAGGAQMRLLYGAHL